MSVAPMKKSCVTVAAAEEDSPKKQEFLAQQSCTGAPGTRATARTWG